MNDIYKPQPISGFPEWLPEHRRIEQQWIDTIRAVFESYGFANIETPCVEELDVLLAKGETDKEIYTLHRLHDDDNDDSGDDEARLGLHFDVTVPFARYTAQHFNDLVFPFKRYQIQKVWRGERPQAGRFREFYQCDIDVIHQGSLPDQFESLMPIIAGKALQAIGIDGFELVISNRKILNGYLTALGIDDNQRTPVIRTLDKLDKIGTDGVTEILIHDVGLDKQMAKDCLNLSTITATTGDELADQVNDLDHHNSDMEDGVADVARVLDACRAAGIDHVMADLSIARGFDYYTGTVYEGRLMDDPDFGSIIAGGRYDNLAGQFINKQLPGVGISIGLSRLFSKWVADGKFDSPDGLPLRNCPTDVLVAWPNKNRTTVTKHTVDTLRDRGIRVEMSHRAGKLSKQLSYAQRKGIPYVWFPPFEDGNPHEVKSMATGDQVEANPNKWTPDN